MAELDKDVRYLKGVGETRAKALAKLGVGDGWRVYISHADARQVAEHACQELRAAIPNAVYEILPLSPAFITQGGPGCVAIQVIQA